MGPVPVWNAVRPRDQALDPFSTTTGLRLLAKSPILAMWRISELSARARAATITEEHGTKYHRRPAAAVAAIPRAARETTDAASWSGGRTAATRVRRRVTRYTRHDGR